MDQELAKKEVTALSATKINDMFGGGHIQIPIDAPLPQIKILRETPMFETPDGETVKTIVGHIIYWHHANQYYRDAYGEGEQGPPTCASSDGIKPDGGTETLIGPCKGCEMNVYGSDTASKGKACQNTIRLYVLIDGDIIPCIIKASPSSLGNKESLVKWLTNAPNVASKAGMGTSYQPIKVQFSLHKKDFASGFSASVLDVATMKILDFATELEELRKLSKMYNDFMAVYHSKIADVVGKEGEQAPQETNKDIPF